MVLEESFLIQLPLIVDASTSTRVWVYIDYDCENSGNLSRS